MVPSVIKCDECDFRGSNSFWGSYVYNDDGQLADIPRGEGWCRACASTAPVENLATVSPSPNEARDVTLLRELDRNRPKAISWLLRLFETAKSRERKARQAQQVRERLRNEQLSEAVLRKAIRVRDGRNRCLICGSFSVQLFKSSAADHLAESRWPQFRHPDCGGWLYAETLRIHVHPSLMRRHYSIHGELLFEEPFDLAKELFKGTSY